MLRVPGSAQSLLEAKAAGADVRIPCSPLEAVQVARQYSDEEIGGKSLGEVSNRICIRD